MRRMPLLLVVLLLAHPGLCAGFCLQPDPPRVCTEFFKSDLVFLGTVVDVHDLPEGLNNSDPGWLYDLRVTKMYRGPQRAQLQVFTENNSARLPLEFGRSYLLFANQGTGVPEIFGCGNSAEVGSASSAITEIRKTMKATRSPVGGDIGGILESYGDGTYNLGGIVVSAENSKGKYHATTSSDGSFHIHAPAGTYRVKADSPSLEIFPYGLSYESPGYLKLENGGCADLVFEARPKKPR